MITCDIAVLGCGWTGALMSYFLTKIFNKKKNVLIIEAEKDLGGLMKTVVIKGYTFDISGSHVIFSRKRRVIREIIDFLKGNVIKHHRRTYIYFYGRLVPYPFENGIYVLPAEVRSKIAVSFIKTLIDMQNREEDWKPHSLRDWIYSFFGKETARLYLEPYNLKVWKRDLDTISADWVYTPGRLPIPEWHDVIRSAIGIQTKGYKEQSIFYYPAKGGIQALFHSVLNRALEYGVHVKNSTAVKKIRKVNSRWVINDLIKAKRIVSTIPLKSLVKALNAPEYIIMATEKLDYNRVVIVGVALRRKAPDYHWIYVPDRKVVFHRYAWISNYSPYNAPREKSAVIAEITIPPWIELDKEKIITETIEGLRKIGVVKNASKEIDFTQAWVHEYGYPVYTITHNKARKEVMTWLEEQRILSIGRWGSWHYWNTDRIYDETKNVTYKMFSSN